MFDEVTGLFLTVYATVITIYVVLIYFIIKHYGNKD